MCALSQLKLEINIEGDSCKKTHRKLKTDMESNDIHAHINVQMSKCSMSSAALCEHRQICKSSVLVMMLSSH